MEYWSDSVTHLSWDALQRIGKEFDFVLIGGWAVYLWTGQHKSKDIDVIVSDYAVLDFLKQKYNLQKNERLFKYEIKMESFDVDVYLPHYSRITLPLELVVKSARQVQGFSVACPEHLLVLKQGALEQRTGSVKGKKDVIDVLSLLMYAQVDLNAYSKTLEENGLLRFADDLKTAVNDFDERDLKFLGSNVHALKKWRTGFLKELGKIRV